jgi:transposase
MLQIMPQLRILLCYDPVDFRRGIDRLAALCRNELGQDPYSGAVFVFRNRRGTAVKLLTHDGIGYYLVMRRFSQGGLCWWPKKSNEPLTRLAAQQLQILLYQGNPDTAQFAQDWRKLTV